MGGGYGINILLAVDVLVPLLVDVCVSVCVSVVVLSSSSYLFSAS